METSAPATTPVVVSFTAGQLETLTAAAAAAGQELDEYIRGAALAAAQLTPQEATRRTHIVQDLRHACALWG